MDDKKFLGLRNASPEKRYQSFLNTVTDREEVWLLDSETGYATFDAEGITYLLVWPEREFCEFLQSEGERPVAIEIHDFLSRGKKLDPSVQFMVFSTERHLCGIIGTIMCGY